MLLPFSRYHFFNDCNKLLGFYFLFRVVLGWCFCAVIHWNIGFVNSFRIVLCLILRDCAHASLWWGRVFSIFAYILYYYLQVWCILLDSSKLCYCHSFLYILSVYSSDFLGSVDPFSPCPGIVGFYFLRLFGRGLDVSTMVESTFRF